MLHIVNFVLNFQGLSKISSLISTVKKVNKLEHIIADRIKIIYFSLLLR